MESTNGKYVKCKCGESGFDAYDDGIMCRLIGNAELYEKLGSWIYKWMGATNTNSLLSGVRIQKNLIWSRHTQKPVQH